MDHITATLAARCDAFITAATEAHHGRYDYSRVPEQFVNVKQKVEIGCPVHGFFTQAPQDHKPRIVRGKIRPGHGCPDCSSRRGGADVRFDFFLARARTVHGNRYRYDDVTYVGARTPITVVCREHGPYPVRPKNHLEGEHCPSCGTRQRAKSMRDVHGPTEFGDPRRKKYLKKAAAKKARESAE
ncbi:hypothetical protein [Curtobacterium flaccumfaciens]|uniref:hypothetical protein n=1 Tax=Curtobacterium flaccumfaciens TaxID=2035 RepID=UPI00188CFF2D|nr:hypothetical protein [Curtobacterium flaccumfaciens]MBF4628330.1 hypothetical protein [Curtobacterium flaccumfaciens]